MAHVVSPQTQSPSIAALRDLEPSKKRMAGCVVRIFTLFQESGKIRLLVVQAEGAAYVFLLASRKVLHAEGKSPAKPQSTQHSNQSETP